MSKDKITIELTPQHANQVLGHISAVEAVAVGKHALLYSDVEEEVILAWARSPLGELQTKLSTEVQVYVRGLTHSFVALGTGTHDPRYYVEPEQKSEEPAEPKQVRPFCPKPDRNGIDLKPGDYVRVDFPGDDEVTFDGMIAVSDVQRSMCEDGVLAPALMVKIDDGKILNPASRSIELIKTIYAIGTKDGGMYEGPNPSLKAIRKVPGSNHGDCIYAMSQRTDSYKVVARWHEKKSKWTKGRGK